MYKCFDRNASDDISLHDCRATKVFIRKGILSFEFEDGLWISEKNRHNPYGKMVRTDKSRVDFRLLYGDTEDDVTFYVFKQKKHGKVIRKQYSLKKLVRKINEKGRQLEFLYAYKGYNSIIFECELWYKKKPYSRECVLIVSTEDVVYRWNNICENKVW